MERLRTLFGPAYRKFQVALGAALLTLVPALPDGMTGAEWATVAIAVLGALGVKQVANTDG